MAAAVQASASNQPRWHWDPESTVCALQQEVSDGRTFEISRTPANGQTSLSLTQPARNTIRQGDFRDGLIQLDPGGNVAADVFDWVGVISHRDMRRTGAITDDQSFMSKFATANAIEFQHQKLGTIRIPILSAAAVVRALQECEDKKMRDWGIDPLIWRALRSPPTPLKPLSDRFSAIDYPPEALRFLVAGDALTRLEIDADGRVTRCRSINASKYKGFEYATCNVLKGARFKPALNSNGEPVSAPYVLNVRFAIGP
jgi:TonB family protein